MAVRVAATIKPMNDQTFPVAEAENLTIETDKTLHTKETIQDLYDTHRLGGLTDPVAANKMLVSKAATAPDTGYVWETVDADNDELANSAGYQTSSDVSTAIGTALTADFGANHASGQIVLNSSNAGSVQVGPTATGVTVTGGTSGSSITVGGPLAASNVTIASNGITIHGVAVATMTDIAGVAWTTQKVASYQDLPNPGSEHVVYFVPDPSATSPDIYEEYIWTIVDDTTTPVTYGYEKLGDTNISLAASNITYTNVAQTGVTNVAGSLDTIITDTQNIHNQLDILNAAIDLVIKSYTMSPATTDYEKGSTISANGLTFTWSVNKPLSALTFDGTSLAVSATTAKNSAAVSANKTFTLNATAGSQTASKSISIRFLDSVYYGSSATGIFDSTFVRGLSNSVLKASYSGSYAITVATDQYGFIAFPTYMNAPAKCKIGGFDTEMEIAGTFNVTNASGHVEEYILYGTTNSSLGSITLVY